VPQIAFCGACRRYIELTADGQCPEGHPRGELRDVREGTLESAPLVGAAKPREFDDGGLVARLIGWSVVLVPAGLLAAFALWTGYEQFSGSGMSPLAKFGLSFASLIGTLVIVWIMSKKQRRR
jgi:hypothetical protein